MPAPNIARPFFRPSSEELRFLPEGPRMLQNYPGRGSLLAWVAIQHGASIPTGSVNLLDVTTGENDRHDLPGRPGFFAETDRPGVLVVGLERRLVLYDLLSRSVTETGIEVSRDERVIINEGMATPQGLLFGTKDLRFQEAIAAMYLFDAGRKQLFDLAPQICSNGKHVMKREGRDVLVNIDSPRKTLDLFEADWTAPRLSGPAILADFRGKQEVPDGLRPTPDGRSAVVCFYHPGAVASGVARQVSLESGEVEREWQVPGSPRVTCPEFAWLNGSVVLFFTTAVEGMPADVRAGAPEAGSLFVADTGFEELPAPPPLVPADCFF